MTAFSSFQTPLCLLLELICISPDLYCNERCLCNAHVQLFLSEFTFEFTLKEGYLLLLDLTPRVTFVTV